jgi:hypothetical protein
VYTEPLALGVIGKIQVGVLLGPKAIVIVPACGVPDWAGTEPNPPLIVGEPLLLLLFVELLLQAARAVAPTTAQTAIFITGWATLMDSPCSQAVAVGLAILDARIRVSASGVRPATFLATADRVAVMKAGGLAEA